MKQFCESCRKDVEYNVFYTQLNGTILGKEYTYLGKIAHCVKCGAEIFVPEINDFNLDMLNLKYNQEKGGD